MKANGRKVLVKHLATMSPVIADAAKSPKASTTYATNGKNAVSNVVPIRPTEINISGRGSFSAAVHPYSPIASGRVKPPIIARGRRCSG